MESWIIAVSGGPDSMALLDMMRIKGVKCLVAHVNYNMRDSSVRDQKIVENYCAKHNLQFEVLNVVDKKPGGNFQKYARDLRYSFFKELSLKYPVEGVMTAHHLDDDIETYLMQKQRGMVSSFIGISSESEVLGLKVVRPLLKQSKESLLNYCIQNNIEYGIDETNDKPNYTRNALRLKLKEMDKGSIQAIKDEMESERMNSLMYVESLEKKFQNISDTISSDLIADVNELRYWLNKNNVPIYSASKLYLEDMLSSFNNNKGTYTFGDYLVYGQYDHIFIDKIKNTYKVFDSLEYGDFGSFSFKDQGQAIEALHLHENDFPITVRNPKHGDKIKLRIGTKSVNRFFIDRKIPLGKRKNWILIENSNQEIVFVVGIGCDIHHYSNNSNLFVIKL